MRFPPPLLLVACAAGYQLPCGVHVPQSTPLAAPWRHASVRLQEQKQRINSAETYDLMMSTLMTTEEDVADQVSANYNLFDYSFLTRLEQRAKEELRSEEKERLTEISEAITAEMSKRMSTAAETLRDVMQSPTAIIMEGKMAGLARQGKLDMALWDLLEANHQQAQAAGEAGKGAVQVITKLQARVREELDKKLDPPIALLRQLLRIDSSSARVALLKQKMAPKSNSGILLATNLNEKAEAQDTQPEVPPKVMAEAIKDMKLRFGNVDENFDTGFVAKLEAIADEAESVALDLAGGKELTPREQQDMMWNKGSVSVWDLSQIEEEAEQDGKVAMWTEEGQRSIAQEEEIRRASVLRDNNM